MNKPPNLAQWEPTGSLKLSAIKYNTESAWTFKGPVKGFLIFLHVL